MTTSASTALPRSRIFHGRAAGRLGASLAEATWLAILLCLPLVMNVNVSRSFEAAKLMAVAPLAVLCLAGLIAVWTARAAPPSRTLYLSGPALAMFAFTALAILSTAASETPWIAFFGDYFRREGLALWLLCAIVFTAVLTVARDAEQRERIIDVLLLSTVMPCVYAVMQRYGYDIFLTQGLQVGTAGARPGGTMGNPTFLASLLLLIIPATFVRTLTAGSSAAARAPWLLLLGLQMFAALLTQSRGPLLGLGLALFILLLLLGARARARALVAGAFAVAALGAAALALINFVPALAQATAGTPLQRFVFTSSDQTVDSRLGIWQAGVDSFLHAPLKRQLIGYGPDAASFNYFNWMPANAQRNEGYTETIDKLHNEVLESLLSFGLLGLIAQILLASSLVWMAAQRLLPPTGEARGAGRVPAWAAFGALVTSGLALGALAAGLAGGSRSLVPVGAGIGAGVAWTVFLAWRAWRHVRAPAAGVAADPPRADGLLIAALISALIGSWMEVQVGVPTIATRAVAALYAALLVLTAHSAWRATAKAATTTPAPVPALRKGRKAAAAPAAQATPSAPSWTPILGWAAGLALVIGIADFFPALSGASMLAPGLHQVGLVAWPQLLTLLAALGMALHAAHRLGDAPGGALTRFVLWCAAPLVLFCIVYAKLGAAIDNAPIEQLRERIAALTDWAFAAYALIALALALVLWRRDRGLDGAGSAGGEAGASEAAGSGRGAAISGRSGPVAACVVLLAGLGLAVAGAAWVRDDYRADVGAKLGAWAQGQGRSDMAAQFLLEARQIMPRERRFAGAYAARMIESASQDAQGATREPAVAAVMLNKLRNAQQALAEAHAQVPRDPWITFALANAHQFMALKLLSNIQAPPVRKAEADEARKYLKLAHEQFPGHPWILRNWAQLEYDQGNRALAFEKLKEMEAVDPRNLGAYGEWIKFARMDNNPGVALAAARRGLEVLPRESDEAAQLLQELVNIPLQNGRLGEAISGALEYTAAQPMRIRAWLMLADLYAQAGYNDLAIANAQSAIERFAQANKTGQVAQDYTALQQIVSRLKYGAAGSPEARASVLPPSAPPVTSPRAGIK
jgi:O-antigen ligase/tetratricopeptide (TPR) repeat protein